MGMSRENGKINILSDTRTDKLEIMEFGVENRLYAINA